MTFLFFSLSVLFGLAVLHPFIMYPLSLNLFKQRPLKKDSADDQPKTLSVCMCAYNEEKVIREKALNLMALKKMIPDVEILIYVDCASDSTAAILDEFREEFDIHVAQERHGKTYGMNLLVSKAKGDIVLFTDANVMLEVESIPRLFSYFADPEVGCVCGHLVYINDKDGTTAQTGSLYWRIEEMIKQFESDTGSVMGADGSLFAIRRTLHTPPPPDIIDDMYVSFSILCDGFRIVRALDVRAFERSATSSAEEFKRKVRISCQAFNVHRLLWPRLKTLPTLDLYKYVSHKLIRWFGILWIGLSAFFFFLFLSTALSFFTAVLVFALAGGGLWYGHKNTLGPIPQIVDILASYTATGLGVYKSIKGERFQTWDPAQSVRKATV